MRVELAGYNIDARVIESAKQAGVPYEHLTPEVISAAYARISRDPRPVGELRLQALEEIEKARSSNRAIIFEMGHHSIAEHAVFNFDITGISRLAIEFLQRFRLCSFTEKSQRYITLDNDFVIPAELRGTKHENELLSLVSSQSQLYEKFNSVLRQRIGVQYPNLEKKRAGRNLLDGWAKEDARYVTLLATTGQLGVTANARNLELMVRRFAASPLVEVRDMGKAFFKTATKVAPSLLIFTDASPFDAQTPVELASLATDLMGSAVSPRDKSVVKLLDYTPNADQMIAGALLGAATNIPFEQCRAAAGDIAPDKLSKLFDAAMRRMEFFDAPSREFEHVTLTFELTLSSSAFAQLKRHRMSTQTMQQYDPSLGVTVPPSITDAGLANEFMDHVKKSEELYEKVKVTHPFAASYVLTNAHRRRVLITTNLRELYHLVRLREDAHAQWDIRDIARLMRQAAEEAMPLGTMLLCGKDDYVKRYENAFGRKPSIVPPS